MKKSEAIYAAGFFDGEGCVYVKVSFPKNGIPCHALNIIFYNTHLPVLEEMQEWFGGQINAHGGTHKGRTTYRLTLYSKKAERTLRLIRPWLRVKAKQVDLALAFQKKVKEVRYTNQKQAPLKVILQREELRREILSYNMSDPSRRIDYREKIREVYARNSVKRIETVKDPETGRITGGRFVK